MAVVYKRRKTFGGIEIAGSIDDKQVIIGNNAYPLSRILSASYDSRDCVIRFCGTKEDLSDHVLTMLGADLAKYQMKAKRQCELTEHPLEMVRALGRVNGGRFHTFAGTICYDSADGDPSEGYRLIKQHSRIDEFYLQIIDGYSRYPLRGIGIF